MKTVGSFLADAVPGLGTLKGLQEIFTGVNYVTGDQLSVADRVANGGGVLLSWVPGGKIAGKALTKGAIDGGSWVIAKVAKEIDNTPKIILSKTIISRDMKEKILEGQRKVPKNELIGGHSSTINNNNASFAVEVLSNNADGTKNVLFTKQFSDGNISKLKKSTLFPDSWNDEQILNNITEVGNSPAISTRLRDGATWHRKIINNVEVDFLKIGDDLSSGYPTGTKNAPRPSGF